METRKCLICLKELPLNKFNRNRARGNLYGYFKKCKACIYDKYDKGKRYGKRFKWIEATAEEKKERMLKLFKKNTDLNNETGCLIWNKKLVRKGYPAVNYDNKFSLASRVCWKIHNGDIPQSLWVLHKCDNPACIEITHLFLGTASDNRKDCVRKGRMIVKRGEESNFCKLTTDKVKEIKKLLSDGLSQSAIAKIFGVSRGAICDIKRGRNWKHVN